MEANGPMTTHIPSKPKRAWRWNTLPEASREHPIKELPY